MLSGPRRKQEKNMKHAKLSRRWTADFAIPWISQNHKTVKIEQTHQPTNNFLYRSSSMPKKDRRQWHHQVQPPHLTPGNETERNEIKQNRTEQSKQNIIDAPIVVLSEPIRIACAIVVTRLASNANADGNGIGNAHVNVNVNGKRNKILFNWISSDRAKRYETKEQK